MAEDTSVDIHQYPAQALQVVCEPTSPLYYDATPASSETSVTPPHDVPSEDLDSKSGPVIMAKDTSVDIHQYPAQALQVVCEPTSPLYYDATPASSETLVTPPHDVPSEDLDSKSGPAETILIEEPPKVEDEYKLKWITWKNCSVPIVTQNMNGPCPLIAIANVLLLQRKIALSMYQTTITASELITHITDNILKYCPENNAEMMLNFEQNLQDAITLLPQLFTGLDVNVKFTGVTDFEFTEACTVFDLLNIPLYHGWVVDPQASETVEAIGNMGYNQLVETIIQGKVSDDCSKVTKALLAEHFLETSASQLTYHGLYELSSTMNDGEVGVLFRNNHFSTVYKLKVMDSNAENRQNYSEEKINPLDNALFVLVTDQGFLHESSVVWEMLCNIEGDSMFVDSNFRISRPTSYDPIVQTAITEEQQIDQDYMVALAVQESFCQLDDPDSVVQDSKKNLTLDGQSQWPDEKLARWLDKEEGLRDERQRMQRAPVTVATCALCAPVSRGGASNVLPTAAHQDNVPCTCNSATVPPMKKCSYTNKNKPNCTIL